MNFKKEIFNILKRLNFGERCVLYVSSGSMCPLIDTGDKVIMKKTSLERISKFDIVAFYSKEYKNITVHRVIKITKKNKKVLLITKGDNKKIKDSNFLDKNSFLGKIIFVRDKKINLDYCNYSWLRFYLSNDILLKIKQKLFYFVYKSKFQCFF